ncbi:MAG TPA: hypothetical protein VET24_08310 [Actinomycetota bacterium]|nr:hypothetical protein [Actinomycetota bacterium]
MASEAGLNALISKLRKTLGPGVIDGRSNLRLRLGDDCRVDVEAATQGLHRAESQSPSASPNTPGVRRW